MINDQQASQSHAYPKFNDIAGVRGGCAKAISVEI